MPNKKAVKFLHSKIAKLKCSEITCFTVNMFYGKQELTLLTNIITECRLVAYRSKERFYQKFVFSCKAVGGYSIEAAMRFVNMML